MFPQTKDRLNEETTKSNVIEFCDCKAAPRTNSENSRNIITRSITLEGRAPVSSGNNSDPASGGEPTSLANEVAPDSFHRCKKCHGAKVEPSRRNAVRRLYARRKGAGLDARHAADDEDDEVELPVKQDANNVTGQEHASSESEVDRTSAPGSPTEDGGDRTKKAESVQKSVDQAHDPTTPATEASMLSPRTRSSKRPADHDITEPPAKRLDLIDLTADEENDRPIKTEADEHSQATIKHEIEYQDDETLALMLQETRAVMKEARIQLEMKKRKAGNPRQ